MVVETVGGVEARIIMQPVMVVALVARQVIMVMEVIFLLTLIIQHQLLIKAIKVVMVGLNNIITLITQAVVAEELLP